MIPADRRRRVVRLALAAAGAMAILATPLWGAYLGRQLAWLKVDRVEIAGARLIAPHEVLEASGIHDGQHLLDERERWESAILRHPAVEDVQITRRPPSTLHVRIREKVPIAFVAADGLRPATAAGEILPLDPLRASLDLPIVHGSLADSAQAPAVLRLLQETQRLGRLDSAFMAEVSEIRHWTGSGEAMLLLHRGADVLLPFGASAARLAELGAVIADLEHRRPTDGPALRPRLDLRFDDQIVVRPMPPRELS